jgi:hypothetical protein
MHRIFIAVLVVLTVTNAVAQTPKLTSKAAWDWSLDERIAERFDADRIRERALANKRPGGEIRSQSASVADEPTGEKPPFTYLINGNRNPELFLPHELFDMLLSGLTPDESLRAKQRTSYQASLRNLGYDDTAFWNALASVTGEYLTIRFANNEKSSKERCRTRFEAFEAAKQLFGAARFQRTLYAVIAPTAFYSAAASHDVNLEAQLRQEAQGCR